VSLVRYELSLYIPEDDILHSHRRESLKLTHAYEILTRKILRYGWLLRDLKLEETLIKCVRGTFRMSTNEG
jgi:hypothetical protein